MLLVRLGIALIGKKSTKSLNNLKGINQMMYGKDKKMAMAKGGMAKDKKPMAMPKGKKPMTPVKKGKK